MDEIIQKLNAALGALNNISVSGKANLSNLVGSITLIEDVGNSLINGNFAKAEEEKPKLNKG